MDSQVSLPLHRSPRARRRAFRLSLAAVAVVGLAFAFKALPSSPERAPEHFSNQPAQLLEKTKPVHLTRADRHAIDATLERFVQEAMGRTNLAASYALATPTLRGGLTLAQWKRGNIPVYPYTARPGSTEGWNLQFVEENHAALEVFLQPGKGEQLGPVTVAVDLRKQAGRWRVDGLAPTAIFSKAGEKPRVFANTDLQRGNTAIAPPQRLDAKWLFAPVAAIVLMLLAIPAVLFARRRHG
jgi:hypothetical protein